MLRISNYIGYQVPSIKDLLPALSKYMTAPIFSARTIAASFPLGNINPYNKSYMDIHAFATKFAVVPPVLTVQSVTLK